MPTTPRAVRYRCEMYARVELPSTDEPLKARVLEMSENGAFLEESSGFDDQQVGDEGLLTLALPGGDPWSSPFRVVRLGRSLREVRAPKVEHVTVSTPGYGVEFVTLDDDELERLRDFLELLELR